MRNAAQAFTLFELILAIALSVALVGADRHGDRSVPDPDRCQPHPSGRGAAGPQHPGDDRRRHPRRDDLPAAGHVRQSPNCWPAPPRSTSIPLTMSDKAAPAVAGRQVAPERLSEVGRRARSTSGGGLRWLDSGHAARWAARSASPSQRCRWVSTARSTSCTSTRLACRGARSCSPR